MIPHRRPVSFVERTLLFDLVQLHVDLLGEDRYGIATQASDYHGTEIGDVRVLAERRYPATDAILRQRIQ